MAVEKKSGNWVAFAGIAIIGLLVGNGIWGGKEEVDLSEDLGGVDFVREDVGFTSRRGLESHFEKHGAEFGEIGMDEYLLKAQTLRDEPLKKGILEETRESDGVVTRFRLDGGEFVAFHEDLTIRTFFKPNDGKDYFWRQLER